MINVLTRTKRYGLLGRMTVKSEWYGLSHVKTLREVRVSYRHAVSKGWRKTNLKIVRDVTTRTREELKP